MKKRVSAFMVGSACPLCNGKRLKRESLSVTFAGLDIGELCHLPFDRLTSVLAPAAEGRFDNSEANVTVTLSPEDSRKEKVRKVSAGGASHAGASDVRRTANLSPEKRIAAQRIAADLMSRITTLQGLGLGYLSIDRATPTLSPGELQRLRLATQIRSNLFGVIYVLDEPSAGLHPADNETMMQALDQLIRSGNSIFVVEHDLDVMRRADWLVDVGPAAGEAGGEVLYSGEPAGLEFVQNSQTAHYLFSRHREQARQPRTPRAWLVITDVWMNNLAGIEARFPVGAMCAVTGVSGSGKSSLVTQALVQLVQENLGSAAPNAEEEIDPLQEHELPCVGGRIVSGMERIRRLVHVDQKPIGRTPRSNLATYTGLFTHVRKLFADTPDARLHGFDAGRFSFNVAKGRCQTCEGEGFVSVELLFMPSVYAPCPTCHGARFNESTLKITFRGKNIADVLHMTVDQAQEFFCNEPVIAKPLRLLGDIGLGYLRLGQPATELSGGEAQRIKLATELQRAQRGDALYVLDEPTTGLHAADVDKLLRQLQSLVDAGNTVIVVEHDMRVIAACDWVIDLGPGGGSAGGQIVESGTPLTVAQSGNSLTAAYLKKSMAQPRKVFN